MVDRRVEDRFIDFHFGKQDLTLKVKHGNGEYKCSKNDA